MNKAATQSDPQAMHHRQIDFVPSKPISPASSPASKPESQAADPASSQPTPPTSGASSGADTEDTLKPAPVMSAKDAINAMYATRPSAADVRLVSSAREAVNAAVNESAGRASKSASNLHHGSIQKSLESARPSASAILRRAQSDDQDVPVVRTSLKLGKPQRIKSPPVVLPPNSRMAKQARPVQNLSDSSSKVSRAVSKVPRRRVLDREMLPPRRLGSPKRALSAGPSGETSDHALTVEVLGANSAEPRAVKPAAKPNDHALNLAKTAPRVTPPRRSRGPIRDPQMLPGRPGSNAIYMAQAAQAAQLAARRQRLAKQAEVSSPPMASVQSPHPAINDDNGYVMAEPPKLSPRHPSPEPVDDPIDFEDTFGGADAKLGDRAPIGALRAQQVAAGHGGPASEDPASYSEPHSPGGASSSFGPSATRLSADTAGSYSFSRKPEESKARPPLGATSPFLKSVSVEKRPLSGESKPRPTPISKASDRKSRKSSGSKKSASSPYDLRSAPPSRPTVIIPASRRSKFPLFLLVVITILLGAAVGASVYLCFFQ